MYTLIDSQEPLTLVSLEEVKRQCRLMDSFVLDDDYLTSLILVCSELAQTYTHRLLTPGSISAESDKYQPVVSLPWGGVTAINQVVLDGVVSDSYTFSHITQKLKINTSYSNIQVSYDCGFIEIPAKVKQAILFMVSTMYNNRDDYITGMTVEKMPMTSQVLLNSVRYYGA